MVRDGGGGRTRDGWRRDGGSERRAMELGFGCLLLLSLREVGVGLWSLDTL